MSREMDHPRVTSRAGARVATSSSHVLRRGDGRYAKPARGRIWAYASRSYSRPRLSSAELRDVSSFYQALTGDAPTRKQPWLAMMARVHPDDYQVLLTALYLLRGGSVANLIGDVILDPCLVEPPRLPPIDWTELATELRWRALALMRQFPARGPIPPLAAIPSTQTRLGSCQSCGESLAGGQFRCRRCVTAIELVRCSHKLRAAVDLPYEEIVAG